MTRDRIDAMLARIHRAFDRAADSIAPSWEAPAPMPRRRPRSDARRKGQLRAWERRHDAWDRVRYDLGDDPIALALFERVKGRLRATPRRSLTETFQEYMQKNSSEVAATMAHMIDHGCDWYGDEPEPTDEELDLASLEATLEGMVAA